MSEKPKRPPVRVRFHYNVDTAEFELIVDDNAPERSDEYHDALPRQKTTITWPGAEARKAAALSIQEPS